MFTNLLAYADPGTGIVLWQVLAAFGLGIIFYIKNIFKWMKSLFTKSKTNIHE